MRAFILLVCAFVLAACSDASPTEPSHLAPSAAALAKTTSDQDANFRFDKDNDDWYCVKTSGGGPMYMDDADPNTQDTAETVRCEKSNYTPQAEL